MLHGTYARVAVFVLGIHRLYLDVMTGEAVLIQPVNPVDFNLGVDKGQNIGRYNMLVGGRTPEEFMALQKRLYHAYDQLD